MICRKLISYNAQTHRYEMYLNDILTGEAMTHQEAEIALEQLILEYVTSLYLDEKSNNQYQSTSVSSTNNATQISQHL